MKRLASPLLSVALCGAILVPTAALASTFETARTIVLSDASTTNAYLAGTDITIVAPIGGDLLAAGATIADNSPVSGDALLAGGTIDIEKPITGDARIAGGQVTINAPVGGDLLAAGGTVTASSSASYTRVAGGKVSLTGGRGPVYVYGSDITLAGDFSGDVTVEASNSLTLTPGTHIHGGLHYNAPQQIVVPDGAKIDGGANYIGTSYLPTSSEAHTFAIAGATVLFIVHLIAVLILVGLVAGLFPSFTERVVERSLSSKSPGHFALLALLGFGILVATPVFILLLLASFVGIGVAIGLTAVYVLFLVLAYVYAGVLAGAALARTLFKRSFVTWRDAVLGMLVLYLIGIIPVIGFLLKFILMLAAGGAVASIAFAFAFRRPQEVLPLE